MTELQDPVIAKKAIAQSLCLQRMLKSYSPGFFKEMLDWTGQCGLIGDFFPPAGFISDLGHLVFPEEASSGEIVRFPLEELDESLQQLLRRYEDYVIGKFCNDSSFERGSDAIRHYQIEDQGKGLAFLLSRYQERSGAEGLRVSPAAFKHLLSRRMEDVLEEGWNSLREEGMVPELRAAYEELIAKSRHAPEVLGIEDLMELERGTAIAGFSQRIAFRQSLQGSAIFRKDLDYRSIRSKARRREVSSKLFEEDAYPIGGFSSISSKGTMESLLQSQLAFMETDQNAARPDIFDIKFVRDELLYYSRDENQFLRQRKTFLFVLHSDLEGARIKDRDLPYQRIVMVMGLLNAIVESLLEMLTEDSLRFEFLFVNSPVKPKSLLPEYELFEMMFRDQIANGTVELKWVSEDRAALSQYCDMKGEKSYCHVLEISQGQVPVMNLEEAEYLGFRVNGMNGELSGFESPGSSGLDLWRAQLRAVLENWI